MGNKIKVFYYGAHCPRGSGVSGEIESQLLSDVENYKFYYSKNFFESNYIELLNSSNIFLFPLPDNSFEYFKGSLHPGFKDMLSYCIKTNIPIGLVYVRADGKVGIYSVDDECGWIRGNTVGGNPLHGLAPKSRASSTLEDAPDMMESAVNININAALLTLNL